MNALLSVKNCSLRFGGLAAISQFSLDVGEGELMAVIGPNGAGKTTFFNILTGVYPPSEGEVIFSGQSVVGLPLEKINHLGVARTFQNIRLFSNLTVEENVLAAFYNHNPTTLIDVALARKKVFRVEKEIEQEVAQWLALFHLSAKKKEKAINLSYGEQRRLEIVRALVTKPKLLLLDEPAAGMNSAEKKELVELIRNVHQGQCRGTACRAPTIILIEHDMKVVMTIAPRIVVLDYGVKIAEGTPDEIRKNPKVVEAYLGESV